MRRPRAYTDNWTIGRVVARESEAAAPVASMRQRIDALVAKARSAARPAVRVRHEVDSSDPAQLFVPGPRTFIDSMIAGAGGINVAADAAVNFPTLCPEEIVRRDPGVIVLADARLGATPDVGATRPAGRSSARSRCARYPIDDSIVSRSGPRLAETYEAYLRLLHPELR